MSDKGLNVFKPLQSITNSYHLYSLLMSPSPLTFHFHHYSLDPHYHYFIAGRSVQVLFPSGPNLTSPSHSPLSLTLQVLRDLAPALPSQTHCPLSKFQSNETIQLSLTLSYVLVSESLFIFFSLPIMLQSSSHF